MSPGEREAARLAALRSYDVLDTPREQDFDDIAELASAICGTPIAVVNLIGEDRQFFKAEVGLGIRETPLDSSFCARAILEQDFLLVPDATRDSRFDCNPLVTGEPHLRFYAGALLKTDAGLPVGTVCVLDYRPRDLTEVQIKTLRVLARQAMAQLELRLALKERRAEELRHRQILDSATDFAIVSLDLDGVVTGWNRGAEIILGWPEREAVRRPGAFIFTEEDRARGVPEREMRGARESGRVVDERWHVRQDGIRFWASGELMRLEAEDRSHVGYLKILRDRTDQHRAGEALREAEAGLRRAQEAGGVGVFWVGVDDDVLHATPAFCRLYGLPERETYPAASFERLLVPEDGHLISGASSRRREGEPPRDVEYRIRRADTGELRYIARKGEMERDESGRPLRFAGVAQDVTERKNAETRQAALLDLGDRLRDLSDPVEISYAACEILGKALGVSRVGYGSIDKVRETITIERDWNAPGIRSLAGTLRFRDYGTYIDDLKRGETVAFADADHDPRTRATASALKAIGAQAVVNMPLVEQGGFVALLYANHATARSWSEGDLSLMREVADRVRGASERARQALELIGLNQNLEQQVAERTRDRDRIWRLSTDMMMVADFQARIEAVNPAWTGAFGWEAHELLGRDFMSLVHPEDVQATLAQVGRLADGITTLRFENRYRHKNGSYRWLSWTAVPDDRFIHAVGRDVQDEKEAAAALRQTEEALRQSQKMEAIGHLTGGIAHDFNNLLTGIVGALDLMQTRMRQGRTENLDRYAKTALSSANRAAALTHRLLAFARRQPLDPKPVSANALISDMEDLLRRTLGERISLEIVTAGGLWPTLCDPHQLENAVLNLAINARDAMPDGGRLTIETANAHLDRAYVQAHPELPPGQYVCICVTDTGTGMSPDVVAKAFDPFFTTKPLGQGTGLGLSMIYGFVRQSEGFTKIYSEVGRGTTVKLYLPRYRGEMTVDAKAAEWTDVPRAERGETVLVVEDEASVRDLIREVLEDLGYRALVAQDGPSGLKLLQSGASIDLVITDVGLPGLNGRQMVDQVKDTRPGLRVLFITGYAENAMFGNGHLAPDMQMITKPFAIETLATRIREMIEV